MSQKPLQEINRRPAAFAPTTADPESPAWSDFPTLLAARQTSQAAANSLRSRKSKQAY